MRPRYVVQVVDDPQPTPPPIAPAPSAELPLSPPMVHEDVVVSAVVTVTTTDEEADRIRVQSPRGEETPDPISSQSTSRKPDPDTIRRGESPVSGLASGLHAARQTRPLVRSLDHGAAPAAAPPAEPFDLIRSRLVAVEKAFREQHLQQIVEQPKMKVPKKRVESAEITQYRQPTFAAQKLEHMYRSRQAGSGGGKGKAKSSRSASGKGHFFSRHRRATAILGGSLGLLLLFCVATGAFLHYERRAITQQLTGLVDDVRHSRMKSAAERLTILERKQRFWSGAYAFTRPAWRLALSNESLQTLDIAVDVSNRGVSTLETALTASEKVDTAFAQFAGQDQGSTVETLQSVSGDLEALQTDMAALQAGFQRIDQDVLGLPLLDARKQVLEHAPRVRRLLLALQQVTRVAPELIGDAEKHQYLVLLQNNQELRATGGFIGSFAVVTVQNGRLLDFRVEDVYEADGQLNGYVTPPVEIIQYLGEEQWFLRDVNWSPDFPTVAQQAAWFLDKELGIQPDGVIALNLFTAGKLLEVTGPVELADFNEVVTKDNLYERAEQHSEINFFPGSTQKKDFLSAVANQLFLRLMDEKSSKVALAQAFLSAAEEAQLLAYFTQPDAQQAIKALGWDGSVRTPSCPGIFIEKRCQVDTVMQVEANVGVNKANEYVERSIDHVVTLEGDVAKHERTTVLRNNAESNAWPQGVYRTYVRWFVSETAIAPTLEIDGQPVPSELVKFSLESGKRVAGVFVEVPIQNAKTLTLRYDTPLTEEPQVYALFEQKQSGTAGDEVRHEIVLKDRAVASVAPEPEIDGRSLIFRSDRQTHTFMAVEFE